MMSICLVWAVTWVQVSSTRDQWGRKKRVPVTYVTSQLGTVMVALSIFLLDAIHPTSLSFLNYPPLPGGCLPKISASKAGLFILMQERWVTLPEGTSRKLELVIPQNVPSLSPRLWKGALSKGTDEWQAICDHTLSPPTHPKFPNVHQREWISSYDSASIFRRRQPLVSKDWKRIWGVASINNVCPILNS